MAGDRSTVATNRWAPQGVENYPLDVLGAHTEGMIDCMIEQALGCLLPFDLSQKAG